MSAPPPRSTAPALARRTPRRPASRAEEPPQEDTLAPEPSRPEPTATAPSGPPPRQAASAPPPAPPAAPHIPPARAALDAEALLAELEGLDAAGMAALMGQVGPKRVEAGDTVVGRVVRVGKDSAFVDIGAKAEAWIPLVELPHPPTPGDRIEAQVLEVGAAGIRLSRGLSGAAGLEAIEAAAEAGLTVEGRVESRNSGGFVIALGSLRGFCPVSMIHRHPGADLDAWIGRTLPFHVKEIRGRDIVLSHRSVAEAAAREGAAALWAGLKPGQLVRGVVTGVRPFGVFVDLGGVSGLVHKSELSWDAEAPPPAEGEEVEARVLEVDAEAGKLSLSLRDPGLDPWSRVGTELVEGGIHPGKVARLAEFGAFIELVPGVQGLAHISTLARHRIQHPSEVLQLGQAVTVRILSIDRARSRIELAPAQEGEATPSPRGPASPPRDARSQSLGTLGDLLGAVRLKR